MKEYLMIGQVLKPQGIKGEIKVKPETDDPERFLEIKHAYLDEDGSESIKIRAARTREGLAYLFIEGIDTVEKAETLRNRYLYVSRKDAKKLPEGRYFIVDLVGLLVIDEAGNALGKLTQVHQAGGNDVYQVKGERSFMFPALKKVIKNVDLKAGTMTLFSQTLQEVAVYDDD